MTCISDIDRDVLDVVSPQKIADLLAIQNPVLINIFANSATMRSHLQKAVTDRLGAVTAENTNDTLVSLLMSFTPADFLQLSKHCALLHNRPIILRCTDPKLLNQLIVWSGTPDTLNMLKAHASQSLSGLPVITKFSMEAFEATAAVFLQLILGSMPMPLLMRYSLLTTDNEQKWLKPDPNSKDAELLREIIFLTRDIFNYTTTPSSETHHPSSSKGEDGEVDTIIATLPALNPHNEISGRFQSVKGELNA